MQRFPAQAGLAEVKVALVMQSIMEREQPSYKRLDDFGFWCDFAQVCQRRYFRGIVSMLLILFVTSSALALMAGTAKANAEDVTLTYLGTEVLDSNGIAVPNNAYYVDCAGEQLTISIAVTFIDGAVQLLTSNSYCQAKIYIVGSIELIEVVSVAGGPDVLTFVYLPMVGG